LTGVLEGALLSWNSAGVTWMGGVELGSIQTVVVMSTVVVTHSMSVYMALRFICKF